MISSVSSDYTGRTKDINIFGYKNPNTQTTSTDTLTFGTTSSYCTGIQKLVQRYIVAFLTEYGSQANYPDFGTNFMSAANASQTATDLTHHFVFANAKVINDFKVYQASTSGIPDDEQLQTVQLNSLSYTAGVLSLNITVLTVAGDNVNYILPLPQIQ